jgi:hypothetical protein
MLNIIRDLFLGSDEIHKEAHHFFLLILVTVPYSPPHTPPEPLTEVCG